MEKIALNVFNDPNYVCHCGTSPMCSFIGESPEAYFERTGRTKPGGIMSEEAQAKEMETLYPLENKIEIAGKKFEITSLKFRKNRQVANILIKAARKTRQNKGLDLGDRELLAFDVAQEFIGDDMATIYAIVLDETQEWIEDNLDLASEAKLWEAFVEVNDLPLLIRTVQRLMKGTSAKGAFGNQAGATS